jgi:phospholipase C
VRASYDEGRIGITLSITNVGTRQVDIRVRDAYRGKQVADKLQPGQSTSMAWRLEHTHGWYDLAITLDNDARFEARLAGHVETGSDSISDPAMGGVRVEE